MAINGRLVSNQVVVAHKYILLAHLALMPKSLCMQSWIVHGILSECPCHCCHCPSQCGQSAPPQCRSYKLIFALGGVGPVGHFHPILSRNQNRWLKTKGSLYCKTDTVFLHNAPIHGLSAWFPHYRQNQLCRNLYIDWCMLVVYA